MKILWFFFFALLLVVRAQDDGVEGGSGEAPAAEAQSESPANLVAQDTPLSEQAQPEAAEQTSSSGGGAAGDEYPAFQGQRVIRSPFITQLSHAFVTGQFVHLVGSLTPTAKRIDIKFHAGGTEAKYDVPLYISIRIPEEKFIFKSFLGGQWENTEEKSINVSPDKTFDLRIRILSDTFQIFVNRDEVGSFKRPEDLSAVNFFSARGHFQAIELFRYTGQIYAVPYSTPSSLPEGKRIDISGVASDTFNVSLSTPFDDIALRVIADYEQGKLLRDTRKENIWETAEDEGGFKTKKGQIVDLTIVSEVGQWVLLLNGERLASYAHRLSDNEVNRIVIDGGIELHGVYITNASKGQLQPTRRVRSPFFRQPFFLL